MVNILLVRGNVLMSDGNTGYKYIPLTSGRHETPQSSGSGVQGLSSLYILKTIMDWLNHIQEQDTLP
jgi:hypothetical protein